MEYIETALKKGAKLHGFRSGGGLRVLRVEKDGELIGYGEHPNYDVAIEHLDLDIKLGGETYEKKYSGENARYPHYLTGTYDCSSKIDEEILSGKDIDCYYEDNAFVFEISGIARRETRKNNEAIIDLVEKDGSPREYTEDGITYEARMDYHTMGHPIVTVSVKNNPTNKDPFMFNFVKIGTGKSLKEAIDESIESEKIELEK